MIVKPERTQITAQQNKDPIQKHTHRMIEYDLKMPQSPIRDHPTTLPERDTESM